jgi:nucleotide-binding universal stress UspA family protein
VPAIIETARKLGSDLIVLGHRHLCWLGRLTGRSVCADILEAAPCPVLVIPAPGTEAK